jgi:outer membrane protein
MLLFILLSITVTLDEAINRALMESPIYLQAKNNLLIQQKTNSFIYSGLLPGVYGSYEYYRSKGRIRGIELFDTTKAYNVALDWDLKLTDFMDAYSTHYRNSSAYFSFIDSRNEVIFQVVTAYLNSLMMESLLLSKEKAVERSLNNLRLVEEKLKLGSASRAELLKSKVDNLQAQYDLLRARKEDRVAKLNLKKFIGVDPADSLKLTTPSIEFELPEKDYIMEEAIRNDPTLSMYNAEKTSAKIDLLSNTTNNLFSLSVSTSYGYSGEEFPSSSAIWDEGYYSRVRLSISVPIFTGFSRVNQIMISRLRLSIAEIQVNDREREIRILTEDGYLGYREALEKLKLARATLDLADESYKATLERYRLGESSIIELLSAEEDFLQAQYSSTQALFDWYLSIYKLKRLMGDFRFIESK